jgi:hypothetical protein
MLMDNKEEIIYTSSNNKYNILSIEGDLYVVTDQFFTDHITIYDFKKPPYYLDRISQQLYATDRSYPNYIKDKLHKIVIDILLKEYGDI